MTPARSSAALPARRAFALLMPLVAASGCYQPDDPTDTAEAEGGSGGGEPSSNVGALDGARGIVSDGDYELYWKQYSAWAQGACVELRLKNNGCTVRGWEAELRADAVLTYWADDGGAYFWPDQDVILVEPETSSSLAGGSSAVLYFCAEPAVSIVDLSVMAREVDCADDGDSTDGTDDGDDDPPPGGSVTDGDLQLAYTFNYEDGPSSCFSVQLRNTGDAPLTVSELYLEMSEPIESASAYPQTVPYVDAADDQQLNVLLPTYPFPLEPGERWMDMTLCYSPEAEIVGMTSDATAVAD